MLVQAPVFPRSWSLFFLSLLLVALISLLTATTPDPGSAGFFSLCKPLTPAV